jgi:serine/threonine protein kinase
MIRSLVGTVNWQAPELWHPQPRYDYKVDVFSAGMVYWEMLSGWIGEKVSRTFAKSTYPLLTRMCDDRITLGRDIMSITYTTL